MLLQNTLTVFLYCAFLLSGQEMFGKDAPQYEQVSEDEDWGPSKRKRREKESDAASTLITLYESETKFPNVETTEMKRQLPSDLKSRRPLFRIPPAAVEV